MGGSLQRFIKVSRRELGLMMKNPLIMLSMVVAPLFCYIFFVSLMDEGLPSDLPAGVVDNDNSVLSRNILRNLDAFQQTGFVRQYSNFAQARQALQKGEIYAFFNIPEGLERDASSQRQPVISIYSNGGYLIPSSLLYRDMKTMATLASAAVGREVLLAKGATMDQAMGFLQPVQVDMNPIGNPMLNYSVYLTSTLLPAVLGLMVLMVSCYSIHVELKRNTGREWMEMAGDNVLVAVSGKLFPQTVIFFIMAVLYLILLYGIMGFPLSNGIWPMLAASFMFILASQGLAVFLASAVPSLRWALSLCTLWGVLSIPISGFSFPVMGMPDALQSMSWFFPLRLYFLIYSDQALNGVPLQFSLWYYVILLGFMLLPLLDIRMLKKTACKYVYMP